MRIDRGEAANALRFCWGCKDCSGVSLDAQCPHQSLHRGIDFSARGHISMLRSIRDGRVSLSNELAEYVFREPLCGRCKASCEAALDIPMVIRTFRADLVDAGFGPLENHKPLIEGMRNYSNPWIFPRSKRADWSKKMPIKDAGKEKVDVLYYVGCTAASDRDLRGVAKSAATILTGAKTDFGILGTKENCCGSVAYQLGDWGFLDQQGKLNVESLNKSGAKVIVTACAGCFKMLKNVYPRMGVGKIDAEIFHISEYMDSLFDKGKIELKKELALKVTYHDPCHMGRESGESGGRFAGVYDAPRKVIAAIPGVELVEMERTREKSWCCGAGGGLKSGDMDASSQIARPRVMEAEKTGAELLLSACPFCEQQFRDGMKAQEVTMRTADIVELVREAM